MKEKFVVTIPVYKSGNTKLLNYVSEINCNTLIVPQISSVRTDPSSLAYHINQKYNKSVIITINTVDTNLRFIQSRILGAELFKLNNFLILLIIFFKSKGFPEIVAFIPSVANIIVPRIFFLNK